MKVTEKEIEDTIVTEAEAAVLSGHDWPSAWPIAARLAAHAIFERLKEGVVWEKSGIIHADEGFHEDEHQSYVYTAYEVHTNDDRHLNSLILGTDYEDQALDVHDGQRVQVTVRRTIESN